ncbi:MAG: gamma-glutamyltransferase [Cyclobacteriaceae bacterium]|nr:gamma-glutamyltransferase [Cyclobacteriaceae bacterium]
MEVSISNFIVNSGFVGSMKFLSKKGAVAAGDELTAQAAYEILKSGGNAFDAGLAATMMSFVASSSITSMGGGGFMMARTAGGKTVFFDFFTQTPQSGKIAVDPDFSPVRIDFGDKSQDFHVGLGTAATPGNLAGIFKIHDRFCRLPFREIAAPAIQAAREGVSLHTQTKYQADILRPIFELSAEGREIYFHNGYIKNIGDKVELPLYADFLEFISREGPREFYEGEIADRVSRDCLLKGGYLTRKDFETYKVEERTPLKFGYRGYDIFTTSPPNAGGALIAFTMSLLNHFSLRDKPWGSGKYLQLLTHCIEGTSQARKQIFEKNAHHPEVMEKLFNAEFIGSQLDKIRHETGRSGNTTHVSVADENMNFVAITTSVGEGCGYYIPGTHIMLNNMLGEEDLNPAGFFQWETDRRISSMMSPTIVTHREKPVAALGSGGSNRIRSAIVQTLSNYIDFNMEPDECVNAPRIHWEKNHLDIEPGFDLDLIERLNLPKESEKIYWTAKNMYFGGVHAVFTHEEGNLIPAGDRRRVGAVRVG